MWNVSDRFRQKALELGRDIMCKIHVGDKIFYDESIIEFTFNDILQKNSFSVGCAEPNRFHMIINTGETIPLDSVVRPFIAFDDKENGQTEWCPLGVFYITNRYKKRNLLYLTCYDKMIHLDEIFEVQSSIPSNVQVIFNEVCNFYSIEHNFVSSNYKIEFMPENVTAKEIISWCAGLNGYCLAFDRLGKLVVKDFSSEADELSRANYISFSQNYSTFTVNEVLFESNGIKIKAGEGGKQSRIYAHNDFGTQQTVNAVLKKFKNFKYYSGEIKLKGLPYLEAGDRISVEDRYSDEFLSLVISEIEYRYKGGLSATLFSKKLYQDEAFVLASDLDISTQTIYKELSISFMKELNTNDLVITPQQSKIAQFNLKAFKNTFIEVNIMLNAISAVDDFINIIVKVNDLIRPLISRNRLVAGQKESISLFHLDEYLYTGINTVEIFAFSENGSVSVAKRELEISLKGQFIDGMSGVGRPQAQFYYEINKVKVETPAVGLRGISATSVLSTQIWQDYYSSNIFNTPLTDIKIDLINLDYTLQTELIVNDEIIENES